MTLWFDHDAGDVFPQKKWVPDASLEALQRQQKQPKLEPKFKPNKAQPSLDRSALLVLQIGPKQARFKPKPLA